eukprot:scaffold34050_cov112-Isochrysis_galbana.AAC.2
MYHARSTAGPPHVRNRLAWLAIASPLAIPAHSIGRGQTTKAKARRHTCSRALTTSLPPLSLIGTARIHPRLACAAAARIARPPMPRAG